MFITILLLFILIILVCNLYTHYGKNGRLINLIPGPSSKPIFGNILEYLGSREEQWNTLITLINKYYPIFKFWAFFVPIVSIRHPDDLETILSSKKHMEKKLFYDRLIPWLGDGLFLSEGNDINMDNKDISIKFCFGYQVFILMIK
ncbi:PREDICTED: cytochrome P450 4C1-like [Wasmannia auropunctata]|uniref:cytochrome P450 4C1-like n=1 Tax=Wasmannia auropunctata TaxID=64793 RepID=UPI0005F00AD3|nr:PREDICTED: cytochrome P450 4C1-like [Wasmannia auropunctata]XP_011706008.1 PREDICTED: cytochrome P450 4C1-like [Wasmannia auropunctata]XP_011706009.1 PREDICTED: cytochrome P450 4C1-like [Wasmannia auropunctata]